MTTALAHAQQLFFTPSALDEAALTRLLGTALTPGVDAADLYFQHALTESWSLEDGIVKSGAHHAEQGVGVRAVAGDKQGLAYCDELRFDALRDAAQAARAIVSSGQQATVKAFRGVSAPDLYGTDSPLARATLEQKLDLLRRADACARAADARVYQVNVNLMLNHETVLIAASDGTLAADVRPLVRMDVSVMVEHNGRRESGHSGGGGRAGIEVVFGGDAPERYAREAVRLALVALDAVPAPAGSFTVVLGAGWPGILLHEAVGHGLEGDFNRKGSSAFSGRIGQSVASPLCTIVDDGTLAGRRGSMTVDDEGTPSHCTTLIEDGILKGYLQDKLNARLMGMAPTGNGRRENYSSLVMPRMTNTYMRPGKSDPKDILSSVQNGLYAVNFGGGQVDITSGNFVFAASEAYLIENGQITKPVKGATLIGNGPETLKKISMVGHDLQLDSGVGTCGKEGQSVPVGVGQPTLRIDGLTVGGTQA